MKIVSKQSGFTLVEEIASLAIISIVLVAFLPIISGSLKNIHVNGNRTINVSSAENKIGNAIKGNSTTGVVQTNQDISITLKKFSWDNNTHLLEEYKAKSLLLIRMD